eukprot:CAMPEP_0196655100 /NCGR_PEP_ID=MMETSP1086-20130531/4856_1 /TAXON_ID=77921 /ORGANISM="Cyanoptyche  gloeocystis , Strain SAG4.97" /LENGTH=172 /DNA_ID=CAMNT_0041987231 /DNA_START=177 /DNA_END=692 /DNA_ORIENTATION=-
MSQPVERSFGIIVFAPKIEKGFFSWHVLIVYQRNGNCWTFPKGKQEGSESELEAALREVEEETGVKVEPSVLFQSNGNFLTLEGDYYWVNKRNTEVRKRNTFFVGKAEHPRTPEPEIRRKSRGEIDCATWVPVKNVVFGWLEDLLLLREAAMMAELGPLYQGMNGLSVGSVW